MAQIIRAHDHNQLLFGSHAPAWEQGSTLQRRVTRDAGASPTAFPRQSVEREANQRGRAVTLEHRFCGGRFWS
jgi:hypothetical protein